MIITPCHFPHLTLKPSSVMGEEKKSKKEDKMEKKSKKEEEKEKEDKPDKARKEEEKKNKKEKDEDKKSRKDEEKKSKKERSRFLGCMLYAAPLECASHMLSYLTLWHLTPFDAIEHWLGG